jgi:hypothetical protein
VGVAHARAEEEVEGAGQYRVADIAVQPRHRARVDLREAVADDHVGAVLQRLQKRPDLREVVRVVGVAHEDVAAAGGGEAREVGAAVALAGLANHARTRALGELLRAVGRAVVGDHDLARDPLALHRLERLGDDDRDRVRLVEAWDHDRHQQVVGARPASRRGEGGPGRGHGSRTAGTP